MSKLPLSEKGETKEAAGVFSRILEKRDVHLLDKETGHVVISDNKLVSMRSVPGLTVESTEDEDKGKISIKVRFEDNTKLEKLVHMCVGKLSTSEEEIQDITVDVEVGANCYVGILSHCIFEKDVVHKMKGTFSIGKDSTFKYIEGHLHPEHGNLVVEPTTEVNLAEGAKYLTDFQLFEGRAGNLKIKFDVNLAADSVADLTVRVSSKSDDQVTIIENGNLNGKNSKAVLKSKISARERANCEVRNTLVAKAENSKGHIDCQEVLKDNGSVTAIPIIKALHPKSQITHEASLGRVNEKQLETLLSKGLDEDEATEMIIKGLLEM